MFENLSDKLNGVFRSLGNKGRLTEKDVDAALREIRLALLEADVNFKVAKSFVASIRERALEENVLQSLSPGQQVIKITAEALARIESMQQIDMSTRPECAKLHEKNGPLSDQLSCPGGWRYSSTIAQKASVPFLFRLYDVNDIHGRANATRALGCPRRALPACRRMYCLSSFM